jgi:hypothetical protein
VAAKKPLDLATQTLERGGVLEARSDFVELRDCSGHRGTRALLRADEDDWRGEGVLRRKSTNTQKFRSSLQAWPPFREFPTPASVERFVW